MNTNRGKQSWVRLSQIYCPAAGFNVNPRDQNTIDAIIKRPLEDKIQIFFELVKVQMAMGIDQACQLLQSRNSQTIP